jgi:hypothetical protein
MFTMHSALLMSDLRASPAALFLCLSLSEWIVLHRQIDFSVGPLGFINLANQAGRAREMVVRSGRGFDIMRDN